MPGLIDSTTRPLCAGPRWAYDGPMTKSLHVRLPDDLHEALVAEAARLGISLNSLLIITLRNAQEAKR